MSPVVTASSGWHGDAVLHMGYQLLSLVQALRNEIMR